MIPSSSNQCSMTNASMTNASLGLAVSFSIDKRKVVENKCGVRSVQYVARWATTAHQKQLSYKATSSTGLGRVIPSLCQNSRIMRTKIPEPHPAGKLRWGQCRTYRMSTSERKEQWYLLEVYNNKEYLLYLSP
jgi:hypothetical protein